MPPNSDPVIQMVGISKTFPGGTRANDNVSLAVWESTLHAVIGENGAGKSTLVNILFGRIQPDKGRIRLRGEDVLMTSPAKAIGLGLGMVTQHTTMIPALTVLENAILGMEPARAGIVNMGLARNNIQKTANQLGIHLDFDARAGTLSVAALQKAEIVKALYRGASILILDEPTAALSPVESDALFELLHALAAQGTTIIFITHKLREVMTHSSRVTVLRNGNTIGERDIADTYEDELLSMMLGSRHVSLAREPVASLPIERPSVDAPAVPTLELRSINAAGVRKELILKDIVLNINPGEIVGVAGVDGSGQKELAEVVVGLRNIASGSEKLDGVDVSTMGVAERMRRGISFIPEDRQREGLILDFDLAENLLLGRQRNRNYGGGLPLNNDRIRMNADRLLADFHIRATNSQVEAHMLSGGNQQKVVIARALDSGNRLLVVMQPTRGLDIESTKFIHETFRQACKRGLAILLFSLDLDEILALSTRVAVMFNGTIAGTIPIARANLEMIGRLMVTGQ